MSRLWSKASIYYTVGLIAGSTLALLYVVLMAHSDWSSTLGIAIGILFYVVILSMVCTLIWRTTRWLGLGLLSGLMLFVIALVAINMIAG